MADAIEIHGICAPEFEAVRTAFAQGFAAGLEVGAAVCVTQDGIPVVDLWAGHTDEAQTRPWQADTLVPLASTTKIMTTLCAVMLIDRGDLDPDAPVVTYWPEFGKHDKDKVLVRHIFEHSAGLPGWDPPIAWSKLCDWTDAVRSLEDQTLWWQPGAKTGYHGQTFGFLAGELVRRVSGLTPGRFLKQEVTHPIGADFHLGFPMTEIKRLSLAVHKDEEEMQFEPGSIADKVMNSILPPMWEGVQSLTSEFPGANGIGNARSVARITAIFANHGELDGHRFLAPETLDFVLQETSYTEDVVFEVPIRRGFGLGLNSAEFACPGERSLHWGGRGGSICIMDLASRTSLAYTPNCWLPSEGVGDARNEAIRMAYNDIVGG